MEIINFIREKLSLNWQLIIFYKSLNILILGSKFFKFTYDFFFFLWKKISCYPKSITTYIFKHFSHMSKEKRFLIKVWNHFTLTKVCDLIIVAKGYNQTIFLIYFYSVSLVYVTIQFSLYSFLLAYSGNCVFKKNFFFKYENELHIYIII